MGCFRIGAPQEPASLQSAHTNRLLQAMKPGLEQNLESEELLAMLCKCQPDKGSYFLVLSL